jgi:hypothetical protein
VLLIAGTARGDDERARRSEWRFRDPATLAAALLVVVATALAANVVPARRATAVDPNSVLRCE